MVNNGIPGFGAESQYSTSDLGQQIGQQKAQMKNQDAGYGAALPSGFEKAQETRLDANAAESFDQNQQNLILQNLQAKQAGAQGLNPLASGATAIQGNNQIMNAPLGNSFWSNLIGGILGSGAGTRSFSI